MKKNLLIGVVSLIASFPAFSQSTCIKDSAYYFTEDNQLMNRILWTYDNEGRILNETHASYNGSDWTNFKERSITYASNGKIATYEFKDWDVNYEVMMPYSLTTNTYNSNGELTLKDSTHFGSNGYGPFYKMERTYNSNNLLEIETIWNHDNSNIVWNGVSKTTHTYDSENRLVLKLNQIYDNGQWVNEKKWEYTYHSTTNINLSQEEHSWNNSDQTWSPIARGTATLNLQNLVDQTIMQLGNGSNWVNDSKVEYIYNSEGKEIQRTQFHYPNGSWFPYGGLVKTYNGDLVTTEVLYTYNAMINNLSPSVQRMFTYTSSHLIASELTLVINQQTNATTPTQAINYQYNSDDYITHKLRHRLTSQGQVDYITEDEQWTYNADNLIATHKKYLYENGALMFKFDYENYYSNCIEDLSISSITKNQFTVYPNPVMQSLNFEASNSGNAKLYTLTGTLLMNITVTQGMNTIDVTSIESGMYILKLDNGQDAKFFKH